MSRLWRYVGWGVALALTGLATWFVFSPAALAQTGSQDGSQNASCLACHAKPGLGTVTVNGATKSLTIDQAHWNASVHSLLDCTSCHVGFTASQHSAAETQGWYRMAMFTACSNCHANDATAFAGSIHGKLLASGNARAPMCGSCHGSHAIMNVSTSAFRNSILPMCEQCHGGHAQTYLDTYHGQAFVLGNRRTAVCTDCHGAHNILSASDPASTISAQHVVATCAKCHAGANSNFASYKVHVDPSSPHSSIWVWFFWVAYVMLISVVFTFGGVHSFLYFYRGRKEGMYRRGKH